MLVGTLRVYSIFDSKAQAYLQPLFFPNNAVAIRNFAAAAKDPSTDISRFAGDYTLLCIAEWDPVNGALVPLEAHENLGLALHHQNATKER